MPKTSSDDERKRRAFFRLVERYNQLGAMLPEPDQMDTADAEAVKLVLREMDRTKVAIDVILNGETVS
jgi:hypothetical protein